MAFPGFMVECDLRWLLASVRWDELQLEKENMRDGDRKVEDFSVYDCKK
jgi:hypothetical protein